MELKKKFERENEESVKVAKLKEWNKEGGLWKNSYKSLEGQLDEANIRKVHWWRNLKEE